MNATYCIPAENRDAVERKLAELARKARRLRLTQQLHATFAHSHTEQWDERAGDITRRRTREWLTLSLTGDPVRVGAYTFLATLYHTDEGTIINAVPGTPALPQFRDAQPACEHCHTSRRRNDTFVVAAPDGTVKQVGRNCLQDFLGNDPHAVAKWAELLGAFTSWFANAPTELGQQYDPSYSLTEILATTLAVVLKEGWTSRSRVKENGFGVATADIVWNVLTADLSKEWGRELVALYRIDDVIRAQAEAMVLWAQDELLTQEAPSDYVSNLQVITRADSVNGRTIGLAASMLIAYRKALGLVADRAAAVANPSRHLGTVGDRMRGVPVTVIGTTLLPPNDFGPRTLVRMQDDAGNLLVWFTGAFALTPDALNAPLYLTGTVKRHGEFKGVQQTELSRCKLTPAVDAGKQHFLSPRATEAA